ncbi:hypothetical protein CLOM_g24379 [Closterium sp. NIES-68]|nr:hypothetical protein CLOM_g24379 [Closterium sp. NIES-68]
MLLVRGGGDGGNGEEEEEEEEEVGEGKAKLETVEVGGKEFVPVAVKMCLTGDDADGREQLLTEIMVMTALRHPNILRLLGVVMMGETIAMVSEFVPAGDVSQRLTRASKGIEPFPWKDRLRIAVGSLEGLAAIHKEGFIHRDFKAANVLLTKTLVPKVADFGLAKACQDKTHVTTRVAGSFGYIDPEYFERGFLSSHCDTYAFGAFLLELITGSCAQSEASLESRRLLRDPGFTDYAKLFDKNLEGQWTKEQAKVVASIVQGSLQTDWASRPTTEELLEIWRENPVLAV